MPLPSWDAAVVRQAEIDAPVQRQRSQSQHILHVLGDLIDLPGGDGAHADMVFGVGGGGDESTLAGWASTLFSDTSEAAVYCTSIKPELTPPSRIRKAGSMSLIGLVIDQARQRVSLRCWPVQPARP